MQHNESDNTQPKWRRSYNVTDQWGRKWLVSVEKSTGHPAGAIEPCFTDPLATPQQYLHIDEEMPRDLKIDYAAWITDRKAALTEYEGRKLDVGRALYGDRFNPDKKPTLELQRIIGKPPRGYEEIERAAAGDRTLLGLAPDAKGSTYLSDEPVKQRNPKAKAAPKAKRVPTPRQLAALERARAARGKATQNAE